MQNFKCKSGLAIGILGALVMVLSIALLFPGLTQLAIIDLVAGIIIFVIGFRQFAKNYIVDFDEMDDV